MDEQHFFKMIISKNCGLEILRSYAHLKTCKGLLSNEFQIENKRFSFLKSTIQNISPKYVENSINIEYSLLPDVLH